MASWVAGGVWSYDQTWFHYFADFFTPNQIKSLNQPFSASSFRAEIEEVQNHVSELETRLDKVRGWHWRPHLRDRK